LGFEKSEVDPKLYFIMVGEDPLILLLYFIEEFEMTDIGLMHYFLVLEVWQEPGHIFL
jgi:hypothetical protein